MPDGVAARCLRVVGTAWRFGSICLLFCRGWLELVVVFPRLTAAQRNARVQAWCDTFLRAARVTVQVQGKPLATGPVLLAANHVSWLDMVVLQSVHRSRFVAKSEVGAWPVIGRMAALLGTVFIRRGSSRGTAAAVRCITGLLADGECVAVFPEGTTTDGTAMRPFQPGLLQGAIDAGAHAQPVAIDYVEAGSTGARSRVAYVDDDALVASMWRTLGDQVLVQISFGEPVAAAGWNRRDLAAELQGRVQALRADVRGLRSAPCPETPAPRSTTARRCGT